MARVVHISDLHFGRPAVAERLDSLRKLVARLEPDAVAVSGDLTQRCSEREFAQARAYLDAIGQTAPYVVVPGNHDIRWLGAVARNLDLAGLLLYRAHEYKYSRYARHISGELSPYLKAPGVVIAGLNTAHGITRGSLTRRFRDLGVIGQVRKEELRRAEEAFESAPAEAARIVMIHHNPIRGEISGRHGLANTDQALRSFASMGVELVLCGHDHQEAVNTTERVAPGLVISTSGTISSRVRPGRPSSFNLVDIDQEHIRITTYCWQSGAFSPASERSFPRQTPSPPHRHRI